MLRPCGVVKLRNIFHKILVFNDLRNAVFCKAKDGISCYNRRPFVGLMELMSLISLMG